MGSGPEAEKGKPLDPKWSDLTCVSESPEGRADDPEDTEDTGRGRRRPQGEHRAVPLPVLQRQKGLAGTFGSRGTENTTGQRPPGRGGLSVGVPVFLGVQVTGAGQPAGAG